MDIHATVSNLKKRIEELEAVVFKGSKETAPKPSPSPSATANTSGTSGTSGVAKKVSKVNTPSPTPTAT